MNWKVAIKLSKEASFLAQGLLSDLVCFKHSGLFGVQ